MDNGGDFIFCFKESDSACDVYDYYGDPLSSVIYSPDLPCQE